MKKLKAIIASLCLVGALGLATPTITKADGTGPQGASKSTTPTPPPQHHLLHGVCPPAATPD